MCGNERPVSDDAAAAFTSENIYGIAGGHNVFNLAPLGSALKVLATSFQAFRQQLNLTDEFIFITQFFFIELAQRFPVSTIHKSKD
jgi:hypothetical protein